MFVSRVILGILLVSVGTSQSQGLGGLFKAGQSALKQTINLGGSIVSKGICLGNQAVQTGTALVSHGIEMGNTANKIAVGTGLAVAGHALALGTNLAVNTTGKVDSLLKNVPVVGKTVKAVHDGARVVVSSANVLGQAVINGIDNVSNASFSLVSKANQFGAGAVSHVAKIGTVVGQTTVAVGTSLVQTGVDNAFTLSKNVYDQVSTGRFNVSALATNVTRGSQWIINEDSKNALTNLIGSLNTTLSGPRIHRS